MTRPVETITIEDAPSRRFHPAAGLVLVLLLVLLAHGPGLRGDFLLWDDTNHVTQNPAIRALTGANLRLMFTTPLAKLYVPLTWLSFAIDYRLWGRNPFGYHLVNLLLHLANTALVFVLVRTLLVGQASRLSQASAAGSDASTILDRRDACPTGLDRRDACPTGLETVVALLTAALFGLHPTRVESVAWVTERKDVLFGFFYLLALLAWGRWGTRGGRVWYGAALAAFVLAALAKSAAVTFPVVALLLDRYALGRFNRDLDRGWVRLGIEKLPFFAVALAIGWATWRAQAAGAGETVAAAAVIPWSARPGLVGYCALFYAGKFCWPAGLSAIYPTFEELGWRAWTGSGWLLAFGLVTAVLWRAGRWWPFLRPCWLFYLVTLAPTIGLVPVGIHVVADRYAYLPLLGLSLAVSLAVAQAGGRWPGGRARAVAATLGAAVLLGLVQASARRTAVWRNTETLFQSVLAANPRALPALLNLTIWYTGVGRPDEAIALGRRAVEVAPQSVWARKNLALALLATAQPAQAVAVLTPVASHPLAPTAGIPELLATAQRRLRPE